MVKAYPGHSRQFFKGHVILGIITYILTSPSLENYAQPHQVKVQKVYFHWSSQSETKTSRCIYNQGFIQALTDPCLPEVKTQS